MRIAIVCYLLCAGCLWAAEPAPGESEASAKISTLVAELRSDNASNRTHAAKALVAIGPSVAQTLAKAMGPGQPEKTTTAMVDAFVGLGSEAVPMMLALIRSEQSFELRHNPGLHGLLKMGTNALPGLEQALRSPDWLTRGSAIDSLRLLQGMDGTEKGCVKLLVHEAKTDELEKLRAYAADALGYARTYSWRGDHQSVPSEVRDGLHELLKEKSQKVRITAAYSLAKACQDSSPEVLTNLVEGTKQGDAELAYECVFAMNFLETNAAPLLPDLSKALQRGDDRVASEAAGVLAKLGDSGFAPLAAAAAAFNPAVHVSGLNALADLVINSTNHLEATLEILANALKRPDKDTRYAALNSLRRIGVERGEPALAQRIIIILNPLAKDSYKSLRSDASTALEELREVRANK